MSLNGTWIYGDVHHRLGLVVRFLAEQKPERVIWLGDYFDDFGDTPEDAYNTAEYFKGLMQKRKKDIFLLGNHDLAYLPGIHAAFHGPSAGWSMDKDMAINSVWTLAEWRRLRVMHAQCGIWFSHAGFRLGNDPAIYPSMDELVDEPDNIVKLKFYASVQGPLWAREFFPNHKQIFGHTPVQMPDIRKVGDDWTINFDCAHRYLGKIMYDTVYSVDRNNWYSEPITDL